MMNRIAAINRTNIITSDVAIDTPPSGLILTELRQADAGGERLCGTLKTEDVGPLSTSSTE